MKKIFLTLSALAVVIFLSGCTSYLDKIIPVNEIDPPVKPIANKMPSVACIENEVHGFDWYEKFCENIKNGEEYTVVDKKIESKDVKKALLQLKNDAPAVSCLLSTYYSETVTDGTKIHISFIDGVDEKKFADMNEELEKNIEKVVNEVPENADDYEKILFVHDYIINNTEYDYEGAKSTDIGLCHSAYGCLVEGKAVCTGYAAAFLCIMQKLGIESGICTGSNHAWNYVKLDGNYYWVDTTWDDADKENPRHTFLLFNIEQLLNTRTFDSMQSFIPECTDNNNYFVRNGGFFEEYDEDEVIEYFESCVDKKQCEMMFGSYEAYEMALENLIAKSHLYKADGLNSNSISYSRNDDMYVLEILC